MPTAARLVGAIYFAGLAFLVSGIVIPHLPDETPTGNFGLINAAVGLLSGWVVMGPRARGEIRIALAGSLTTMVAMVLVSLLIFSGLEMVEQALRKRYDAAMEAVVAVFEIGVDYARLVAQPDVIGVLLIGALLGGIVTNIAARHWS